MCTCNNCNEITLFKGTNGVGVSSTVNNNDGTFTIYYTDGTSYTSTDLTGPQGPSGIQGPSGTNAFKVVKDFESNLEGGICTITREELTFCTTVPNGCLLNTFTPGFTNLQVQVWLRTNDPVPEGPWFLANTVNSSISINIDPITGTISSNFSGAPLDVLVRMVVIG